MAGSSNTGSKSALNIAAATLVAKASNPVGARIGRCAIVTAGSAPGAIYDSSSTTGNSAANQIAAIPNTVGIIDVDFPVTAGIVVAPGTGQVVSVSYDG